MTIDIPCPALDIARDKIKRLRSIPGNTWRRIAALDAYRGIPPGTLCSIAKGRNPKNPEYRRILGLPLVIEIDGKKYELKEV